MDINTINEILKNVSEKSNKDIIECRNELFDEFNNTKNLIINLTKHLSIIEENYELLNKEILKRLG